MIFSIIVPFLNEQQYLEQCMKSLLNQDFNKNEYELIFIDNGSTDRSKEIVSKYKEILLLQENKPSAYIARNRGLAIAKGNIIAFTDADCEVKNNWLTNIYKGMEGNNAMIVLGKRYFSQDKSFSLKMFEDWENAKAEVTFANFDSKYYFSYTNNMAVRTEVFQKIGFFTEDISLALTGDVEFVQRCVLKYPNVKIMYLEDMKIRHLEIKTAEFWLKKLNQYGHNNWLVSKKNNYSELGCKERLQIYIWCIRKNNYRLIKKIFLALLLTESFLFYKSGKILSSLKYFFKKKS